MRRPTTVRMGTAAAKRNSVGKVVGLNPGAGKVFSPAKSPLRITVSINAVYKTLLSCVGC